MDKSIEIPVNIDISDKDIERLEKTKCLLSEIKQILKEIRDIDDNFSLGNVIEIDEDTILVFNLKCLYTDKAIKDLETFLTNKLNHKCIILENGLSLDKAIGIDYAKGRDYTTVTYYNDEGNPVKEETTQYKEPPVNSLKSALRENGERAFKKYVSNYA